VRGAVGLFGALVLGLAALSCAGDGPASPDDTAGLSSPPVQVVLFTHIEDNTPAGVLGDAQNRIAYVNLRTRLLEMARLAKRYDAKWSLQPDWKYLLAALLYEDATLRSSTGGLNVFRYLRDSLGVAVDPHSHENGYNYTDVAHLLDSLGVGGSTVIGGHIWDPSLPQFQQWDRFRVPVAGLRYPAARWRGDILMGSGTPNHTNDPIVSGVWRPKDRNHYWEDDPAGNIAAVGQWRNGVAGVQELVGLYRAGKVGTDCMLTASLHVTPSALTVGGGLAEVESATVKPLATMRDSAQVRLTDFTSLVGTWRGTFGAKACLHRP
jgi:hypothetical protein